MQILDQKVAGFLLQQGLVDSIEGAGSPFDIG